MKRAYKTTYRTAYKTAHLGSKVNYPVAVAKDSLGNIITPTEYNIDGVDYVAHIFNESGTLEVTSGGLIDYLIVGGGGSGGSYGGGGAGGLLSGAAKLAIGSFPVTVGDGGEAVSTNVSGNTGGNSSFNNLTAIGGGGGGAGFHNGNAAAGGSGGGGATGGSEAQCEGGLGTEGQGYEGGNGAPETTGTSHAGGGGGGAGQKGGDGQLGIKGGDGGIGKQFNFSGTNKYYAGGGGGGKYNDGVAPGLGGEGGGGDSNGGDGTANTGGGGGASRPSSVSGAGGSGIVIVRYKKKITPLNIFLVGGQSNTDGRVSTTDVNTPDYLTDNLVDKVRVWNGAEIMNYDLTDIGQSGNGSSWITAQTSGLYSFAHVALKKIAEIMDNVVVVQVTSGGSPLTAVSNTRGSWNYDYNAIPDDGTPKLLQELNGRFDSLIAYLNSIGRSYVVRGMLWHQGEWDDDTQFNDEANYYTNFTELISTVRNFTAKANLPIIYGTIDNESAAYSPTIRAAQLQVATEDANAHCRDNDALTLFDSYHFDANSCNTFGEWCATEFLNNYT